MSHGPKNPLERVGFAARPRSFNGDFRCTRRSPPPTRPRSFRQRRMSPAVGIPQRNAERLAHCHRGDPGASVDEPLARIRCPLVSRICCDVQPRDYLAGIWTENTVPRPGSLSNEIAPPWRSTAAFAM